MRATADERPLPHLFPTSWDEPTNYEVVQSVETVGDDGTLTLELGPASVVRVLVDNDDGRPLPVNDDGVWNGIDEEGGDDDDKDNDEEGGDDDENEDEDRDKFEYKRKHEGRDGPNGKSNDKKDSVATKSTTTPVRHLHG